MTDTDHKLAKLLVNYSTKVRSGELVGIRYEPLASELALAVYKEVIRAGGQPFFETAPEGAAEAFYELASDAQLKQINPLTLWSRQKADVLISLFAPANTRALSLVDPKRLATASAARRPLSDIFMKRSASGELRWVLTQIATQALAQDAGMSLDQCQEFVSQAGRLDVDDPAIYWQAFDRWQQTVVDSLNAKRDQVHIKGPNIDLTLSVKGREWINCSGSHNFPDGEVFTGPLETSANGWLKLKFPAFYNDNEVVDARLEFKDGRVVKATASRGEAFLNATLDTDPGARTLGELGIGTNEGIARPVGSILFDEKRVQTVHLAVGAGYPETGNTNQSSVHWDMIVDLDDGQITIDDEVVYKDGAFIIGNPKLKPSIN